MIYYILGYLACGWMFGVWWLSRQKPSHYSIDNEMGAIFMGFVWPVSGFLYGGYVASEWLRAIRNRRD